MQTMRLGIGRLESAAKASRQGRASDTPAARKKVRRGMVSGMDTSAGNEEQCKMQNANCKLHNQWPGKEWLGSLSRAALVFAVTMDFARMFRSWTHSSM